MKSYIQPNFIYMAQTSNLFDSPSLRSYAALVAAECMRVVAKCDAEDIKKLFPIPDKKLLDAFDRKNINDKELFDRLHLIKISA